MFARKWLLTSVVFGGLMAAGSGAALAATPDGVLKPNSAWAISRLAATQTGGQPYCALARRFTTDLVFTIARNAQDESSVAIDFQRQALENGQTYNVVLKPGFGQDRAFNIRPVSGKALVIRLGQDYAFHDALSRSGKLDVSIADDKYSFDLADYAEGEKKLGDCLVKLGGGVAHAAASGGAVMKAPAPVERSVAAADEAVLPIPVSASAPVSAPEAAAISSPAANDGGVDALREENERLRHALEDERRIYEDRFLQEGEGSSLAAELKERVRLLETENADLRARSSEAGVPPVCQAADAGGADDLKQQISSLQEENIRLKAGGDVAAALQEQVSSLQAENDRLRSESAAAGTSRESEAASLRAENLQLKQDLAALQARSDMLQKQMEESAGSDSADAEILDGLKARVARLEDENKALKQKNDTLASDGAGVPVSLAQLRSVEEQLRYVQQDRDKLLQQIEAMNKAQRDGRLNVSSDNWNLEQATRRYNEAEREIQRLAREVEEQRASCAANAKKLEYMLFDPAVAEKEQIAKLIDLEDKVRNAQAGLDDQKAVYEEKLAALKKDTDKSMRQDDILKAEYEQKIAVLEKELEEGGGGSSDMQGRIAALESDLSAARQKADAEKTTRAIQQAEYEQKIALLQKEFSSRDSDVAGAQGRITALEKELVDKGHFSTDAQARIAALESELKSRIAQSEDAQARIASLERDAKSKADAAADAQGRVAVLESEIKNKISVAGSAQSRAASLEAELAGYKAESSKAMERMAQLERDLAKAKVTPAVAQEDMGALRKERDEIARQKGVVEAENVRLSARVSALEGQVADIREKADSRVADNETLSRERDRLAARQDDLQKKVSSLEEALAAIPTAAGGDSASAPVASKAMEGEEKAFHEAHGGSGYEGFGESVQKSVEPAVAVKSAGNMITASALKAVLDRAHVAVQGGIEKADDISSDSFVAYSWASGSLFGTAEQQPMSGAGQFDELAKRYLEKTRSRCQGDFAVEPAIDQTSGSLRVTAYEIACVSGADGASASVVFYNDGGLFTAIAHETGLDAMDQAMDVRDRLIGMLMQSQIVSR